MNLKEKSEIMGKKDISRSLTRISHEIIEANENLDEVVIVGIQRRGVPLAKRIVENINNYEECDIPMGLLDITLYRDDLSQLAEHPKLNKTDIPFAITGKAIVLVDDVIFTGRTVRSAIDALIDLGRPKNIQLACLIDRGHRELPIKPNYVGKNVPTSKNEIVSVFLDEVDDCEKVVIFENNGNNENS